MAFVRRPRPPTIVCIDGAIAVGKSTVLRRLAAEGYRVYAEGADDASRWKAELEAYCDDPARGAFLLQTAILEDMASIRDRIAEEDPARLRDGVVVVERSPDSALVFVGNSLATGDLTPTEHRTYARLHRRLGWRPDVVVYLSCPARVAAERMRRRGRRAERGLDEAYLRRVEDTYATHVARWRAGTASDGAPRVVVVDATLSPEEVHTTVVEAIKAVCV